MTTSPVDVEPDLVAVTSHFAEEHSEHVDEFLDDFPERTRLDVPLDDVKAFDDSKELLAGGVEVDMESEWRDDPERLCRHIVLGVAQYADSVEEELLRKHAEARITGYAEEHLYDVGQYSPEDVHGGVIHVRGQVTKRSKRKLRDEVIAFRCVRCETLQHIPQSGDTIDEPHECRSCERQGPFNIIDSESEMQDYQAIRLQTLPEEADGAETEMLTVQAFGDLVGEVLPGDRAVITIEVRTKREQGSRVRELYGDAMSITKLTSDHTDVDVEPHREKIEEIAESEDPYQQLVDSLAPSHTGDETVKLAIVFQLFGGVEKELPDGSWFRGNSHVLMLGDPGTGKSSMARYVAMLVSRSEYATGKKASDAGLTAAAVKDDFADGGWTLEAGTLVRAHNGIAIIDELDKMDPDDRDGMMEAMSEQQITVNMVVSGVLPAKCSVLSAANPKYGTFEPTQDVSAQIDLDPVLLSRFDLLFVMQDEAEEEHDEDVAGTMTDAARTGQKLAGEKELTESEKKQASPPIPPEMFRAYIAMAKRTYPVFTEDARDKVVSEYVDLRQINEETDDAPIPATARQVEAIHRLSEASARIRLAEEVTTEDVQRAVDILYDSLESLGVNEDGVLDAAKFETGTSMNAHDYQKAITGLIEGQCDDGEPADEEAVREEAMVLMDEDRFEQELQKLKDRAAVYEPRTGKLRNA